MIGEDRALIKGNAYRFWVMAEKDSPPGMSLRRLGTYEALDIVDLKAPAAVPEDGNGVAYRPGLPEMYG